MTAAIALGSPAEVETPLFTNPATIQWDETGIDVGMGMNGPKSVSFDADNLVAELPLPDFADATLAAASAEGTLTPTEDGGTQAALGFRGLSLTARGTTLPSFDGAVSARLSAPPRALLSGRAGLQPPLSANAINLSLTSGASRLDAEGDISIDAEGILDGAMTIRIAGAEALPDFIAALPPATRQIGNAMVGGLLAFGRAATIDGKPASELTVEINRGEARVGPVTFSLPRVPL
jgi:hypothetical protein